MTVAVSAPWVHLVVMLGGVVLGFVLRSLLWHWYIQSPRRLAFWLSHLIEEWSNRSGFTHVHVNAGESALPIERFWTMLRSYGREEAP